MNRNAHFTVSLNDRSVVRLEDELALLRKLKAFPLSQLVIEQLIVSDATSHLDVELRAI